MSVKFLYMAPEILQMTDALAIGTREGDVYSFGIMMNEIALIAGPFSIELAESTVDGACTCVSISLKSPVEHQITGSYFNHCRSHYVTISDNVTNSLSSTFTYRN